MGNLTGACTRLSMLRMGELQNPACIADKLRACLSDPKLGPSRRINLKKPPCKHHISNRLHVACQGVGWQPAPVPSTSIIPVKLSL